MQARRERFGYLLAGLVAYLLLGPVAREVFGEANGLLLLIALCSVLIVGIFGLHESKLLFGAGICLAAIAITLVVLDSVLNSDSLKLAALADIFLFFAMSIWLAFRQLFDAGPTTANKLFGGICVYILLGMCWSILYMYLLWWEPDSFTGALAMNPDNPVYWDMVYFSFVTLTTLGYGDIAPAAPVARALAYSEALAGQLFIAIFIGTMVGNMATRRSK